jgi:Na+/melibiose symporter-like transporter
MAYATNSVTSGIECVDEIDPHPTDKSWLGLARSRSRQLSAELTAASFDKENVQDNTSIAAYSAFSKLSKRWITVLVAMAGFFSPLSANIYFPALDYIAQDLDVSLELMNLTITAYLICQCIVPSVFGDLADMIGRRPVYLLVLLLYFAANLGLSFQHSYTALLVLRMVQSTGASGTIALGVSVMHDIAAPHERGKYMGAAMSGYVPIPTI